MTTAATILIIDDEPSLNRMLSTFLGSKGYHVLTASDGQQGLELATTKNPDLILCDLTMPTLDGLEVIARLRQHEAGREIPIIILSGTGERKDVRQSMNLGGDDFLAKPASLTEIHAAIEARLERRQQQRQRQEQLVQTALASYSGIINDVGNLNQPVQWQADPAALPESPQPPDATTAQPLAAAPDTAFLAITGQRREYVKLSQVKLFLACGEYSKACWGKDQNMMFRKAMKQWELELAGTHFVRVHRQAIINLNFFSHLDKSPDGQTQVHLHDFPQPVPVSQRCGPELNRQLKQFRPA
jgi:CheY-like chemotaxis protein